MFACNNCTSVFTSTLLYNDHQKVHRSSVINNIACVYSNCNSTLKNYLNFKKHLLRSHRYQLYYTCKYSGCQYKCNSQLMLKNHQENHLSLIKSIKCKYCQDNKILYNYNTYRSHVLRNHANVKRSFANETSLSQRTLETPVSIIVQNIIKSFKRRHSFTNIDTGNLINDSEIPSKMLKLSIECSEIDSNHKDVLRSEFSEHSTVLDPHSHFINYKKDIRTDVRSNGVPKNHSSEIVIKKSKEALENGDIPMLESIDFDKNISSHDRDDESVEETPNSMIVNSLNWEVEQYISSDINETEVTDVIQNLAKIYIKLSVKNFATESVLQGVMSGMYSAFQSCHTEFTELLSNSNVNDKDLVNSIFNQSFRSFINSHDPKNGILRNTFIRKKFYKENLNLIQPIEVAILDKDGKETQYHYSYVPVLETVKSWLLDDNVRPFCINPRKSTTDQGIFVVKDGNVMKNSEFFNKKNTVQLGFYQDAFEVCNPLGASKSKFKMIGIYMILLNLPPFLRSKTDNIKLIMLCNNNFVSKCGWKQILEKFISDIHILENEGINIIINSEHINFTGSIVACIGDNLGNHSIGGYVENFSSAEFVCQYCEMKLTDFRKNPFDRKQLRTIANYDKDAAEAVNLKKPVKGIKLTSPLNQPQHFHVARPGLAPCVAHDMFEGIVPCDLYLIIKYFIKKKWVRLGLLNYRLNTIKLSNETKKFIPYIKMNSKNKRLTGSASHIKRLMLILPLALYDRIKNPYDEVWKLFLLLREMCCIVSSPALSFSQIAIFSNIISDYIHLRTTCFTDPVKPKHDFIMHYPKLLYEFGPLNHVWTLRFESKHSYFKSIVESLRNFKKIHMTLAEKHELLQASLERQYQIIVESKDAIPYIASQYETEISSLITDYISSNSKGIYITCREKCYFLQCPIL